MFTDFSRKIVISFEFFEDRVHHSWDYMKSGYQRIMISLYWVMTSIKEFYICAVFWMFIILVLMNEIFDFISKSHKFEELNEFVHYFNSCTDFCWIMTDKNKIITWIMRRKSWFKFNDERLLKLFKFIIRCLSNYVLK